MVVAEASVEPEDVELIFALGLELCPSFYRELIAYVTHCIACHPPYISNTPDFHLTFYTAPRLALYRPGLGAVNIFLSFLFIICLALIIPLAAVRWNVHCTDIHGL